MSYELEETELPNRRRTGALSTRRTGASSTLSCIGPESIFYLNNWPLFCSTQSKLHVNKSEMTKMSLEPISIR